MQNADDVVQWKGQAKAEDVFASTLGSSESALNGGSTDAAAAVKKQAEEVKAQTGNLLADIASGKTLN